MHSTLNTLILSGGGLLCSVSTVWTVKALWNRNKRWIRVVLLCGGLLNGVPCCNCLACTCGVLLWSGIGFRVHCLCSIISKRVFKTF